MTAEEIAMKFASASATCRGGERCPYISQCTGKSENCRLKEVAMTIRSQSVKIEQLEAKVISLEEYKKAVDNYADALEKVIRRYESVIDRFQKGYRPEYKVRVRKTAKKNMSVKRKTALDLIEMDGKEEYAVPARPKEPKLPKVII